MEKTAGTSNTRRSVMRRFGSFSGHTSVVCFVWEMRCLRDTTVSGIKMPTVEDDRFKPDVPTPDWFKPHQTDITIGRLKGRAAIFSAFGTGKTTCSFS